MNWKNVIFIFVILITSSCISETKLTEGNIASFSNDFDFYAQYHQQLNDNKYSINLRIYSIPDSLSNYYVQRDSLINLAAQGDLNILDEVIAKGYDQEQKIELNKFSLLREYNFLISKDHYFSSEKKIIWSEESASIHLPTLNIEVKDI